MKKYKWIWIVGAFILVAAVVLLTVIKPASAVTDYSAPENWAYNGINPEQKADLFLICPTVDMGRNDNRNMSLSDEETKENFVGALNMERGIYEENLTLYAPFYRQAAFPVYALPQDEAAPFFDIAYADIRAAFLYYIEQSDPERPFVLAGFSQGADMVLRLLSEFFDDSAYQNRLIAAYCIGWRITDDDLASFPWLKPAQYADDTGTIICFNSEAIDVADSLLVPANVRTHGINPLNWKTDETPASAAENFGACFTDYSGEIIKEIPNFCGAYLDAARGTLKVPDVDAKEYSNSLFPDGVYHLYDYQFFYRNLQENVAQRVEAYFAQAAVEKAA